MPLPNGLDSNDLGCFDDNMGMDMEVDMFVEECGKKDKGDQGQFGFVKLRLWDETDEQEKCERCYFSMFTYEIYDIHVNSFGVGLLD